MADPLDQFIVDKVERTAEEESIEKQIALLDDQISVLKKEDARIVASIPKASEEKYNSLKKEKEVLLGMLKKNKQALKDEEKEMRKERVFLLNDNEERKALRVKIKDLEKEKEPLMKKYFEEVKKRKVIKNEVKDAPAN